MATVHLNSKLENQKEISAFVKQQLSDLAPHLAESTALELTLSESNSGYQAALILDNEDGPVEMVGQSQDVFQAIRIAKEGLVEYCVELRAQFQPNSRRDKISYILNQKSHWLH